MTQEYIGIKRITAWPQEKDGVAGYAVKYPDGYISWSPAPEFEKFYMSIGNNDDLAPIYDRATGESIKLVHDDVYAKFDKAVAPKGLYLRAIKSEETMIILDFILGWASAGAPKLED